MTWTLALHYDCGAGLMAGTEVPTLPFWAEDLPLYVISPVLPFGRKISR